MRKTVSHNDHLNEAVTHQWHCRTVAKLIEIRNVNQWIPGKWLKIEAHHNT